MGAATDQEKKSEEVCHLSSNSTRFTEKITEKMASTGDEFVENASGVPIKMEESEKRPTFEELMKVQRLRSALLLRVSNKKPSCKFMKSRRKDSSHLDSFRPSYRSTKSS